MSNNDNTAIPKILFSIRPEYTQKILNGSKTIELRKKLPIKNLAAEAINKAKVFIQTLGVTPPTTKN